jgi:hypothetical protein
VELYLSVHISFYGVCGNNCTFEVTVFWDLHSIVRLINTQLYSVRSYESCLNTVLKTLNRVDLLMLNENLLKKENGQ